MKKIQSLSIFVIMTLLLPFIACGGGSSGGSNSNDPIVKVSTPVFNPQSGAGVEAGVACIKITTKTSDAAIYYTIDGSIPTEKSTKYTSLIALNEDTTIKAKAFASGKTASDVATASYMIALVATPVFDPPADTHFNLGSTLSISITTTTSGAKIYYTTDGNTPANTSTEYTAPIILDKTTTLKAIAYDEENGYSTVATAVYSEDIDCSIDGNNSEWSTVPNVSAAVDQSAKTLKISNDNTRIYLSVEGSDLGTIEDIYIDVDNNTATGFTTHKWSNTGFDYLIEGTSLYMSGSNGSEWNWGDPITGSTIERTKTSSVLELSILRSDLVNLGNIIHVGYIDVDGDTWEEKCVLPPSGASAQYKLFAGNVTTYTITSSTTSAGGSISPNAIVPEGNDAVFAITPDFEYGVTSVLIDGTNAGTPETYTFSNITSNHTISASFAEGAGIAVNLGPYLINYNDPATMDILFRTTAEVSANRVSVDWGTSESYGNNSGDLTCNSSDGEFRFQYRFTGLTPGAKYYYRVNVFNDHSQTGSFYAVPSTAPASFSFYAMGDTQDAYGTEDDGIWVPHLGKDEVAHAIKNDIIADVSSQCQAFIVYAGDLNNNYKFSDWYGCFFNINNNYSTWITKNTITIASQGNHDGSNTSSSKLRDFFPNAIGDSVTAGGGYYSQNYESVHIVVIEPYGNTAWNDEGGHPLLGEAQWTWLSADLQAAQSDPNIKFIVCAYHTPAYTLSGHTDNAIMQNVCNSLFETYGVDVCLSGHNHYYARAYADNIYHLTLGSGGAVTGSSALNATSYPNVTVYDSGTFFTKFTVTGDSMTANVYKHTGDGAVSSTKVDTFTILATDN